MGLSLVEDILVKSSFIENMYGPNKKAVLYFNYENLNGYGWAFPKRYSVNIGFVGSLNKLTRYGNVKAGFKLFMQFLKNNGYLPKNCISKKVRGGFIPWGGPLRKTWDHRMVLIGDAAGFVSPLSGEGIFYAMDSGRIAAHTISQGLKQHEKPDRTFRRYHKKCLDLWGRDLLLLRYYRSILLLYPNFFLMSAKQNKDLQMIFGNLFKGSSDPMKNIVVIPWLLTKEFANRL